MEAELVVMRERIAEMEAKLQRQSCKSDSGGDISNSDRKSSHSDDKSEKKMDNGGDLDDQTLPPSCVMEADSSCSAPKRSKRKVLPLEEESDSDDDQRKGEVDEENAGDKSDDHDEDDLNLPQGQG